MEILLEFQIIFEFEILIVIEISGARQVIAGVTRKALGRNDSRIKKINVGAETNSRTCSFISLFLDSSN